MIKMHASAVHRARQVRWVFSSVIVLCAAVVVAGLVFYYVSSQKVETEFWHAHKQVANTGDLLGRGMLYAAGCLSVLAALLVVWRFRVTNRIVRPVHALHLALEELVEGNLGVRVALKESDEFQEVAAALNRLVDEFSQTLSTLHAQIDALEVLSAQSAEGPPDARAAERIHERVREINGCMDFFKLGPEKVIREE